MAWFLVLLVSGAAAQLTAGDVDDHLNWDHYQDYLDRLGKDQAMPSLGMQDRITVRVENTTGVPLPLVQVGVGNPIPDRLFTTGADGVLRLLPQIDGLTGEVLVTASQGAAIASEYVTVGGDQSITLVLDAAPMPPSALDVLFVIDTTGSMSDELDYITDELEGIVERIHGFQTDLQLGLIVYRDHGDDYVVRDLGFTKDVQEMRGWLADQRAAGGGDYPEAMDEALQAGADAQWRSEAVKLLFLVADAPPHGDKYDAFLDAAKQARSAGIHIHGVAGSGVADEAEYLMRAAAVMTQGRYAFLTDDSGIGNPHAEPSIPCYVVTHLDDLLVRIVQSDFQGQRIEPSTDQIIREVGDHQRGVCLSVEPQDQQASQRPSGSSGETAGAAAPAPPGSAYADSSDGAVVEMRDGGDDHAGSVRDEPSEESPGVGLLLVAMLIALSLRRRA